MIRTKRFAMVVTLLLAMTLSVFCPCFTEKLAAATTFTYGNFFCTVISGTDIVIDENPSNKPSGALVIPATITYNGTTYTVKTVGSGTNPGTGSQFGGFCYNTGITSVSFASGSRVTSIGRCAFFQCTGIKSMTLPSTLATIGETAFKDNKFTSITLPASVVSIGPGCFQGCTALVSVNASSSKLTTITDYAFDGCTTLRDFSFPSTVTSIGNYAFYKAGYNNKTASTWVMPARLTSIGSSAFFNASYSYTLRFQTMTAPTLGPNVGTETVFKRMKIEIPAGATGYSGGGWSNTTATTYSGGTTVPPTPTNTHTPTPTKKPTNTNTPTATNTPTPSPTQRPLPTTLASSGVAGFIDRIYTIALGRSSDVSGKTYWINQITYNGKSGADIARAFLLSQEFKNKNYSNDQFISILYRVFFDRNADASGLSFYKNKMANGWTQAQVINAFINSTEWANTCLRYGVKSGSTMSPNITVTPSAQVISFVTRFYTSCLGRSADASGVNYWANRLANHRCTSADAVAEFFLGSELTNRRISNDEFVRRMFRTILGREADNGGFNYWMNQFNSGATRRTVVMRFITCDEWSLRCAEAGILK